jgi:hypothetical protein
MMDDPEYVVNTIQAELRRLRRGRHKAVASTATPLRQLLHRLRLN